MMSNPADYWNERYISVGQDYLFGNQPNHYLMQHRDLILSEGLNAFLVADGEGRNSVWLSEQGVNVTACDISNVAIEKARRFALSRSVTSKFFCADMLADNFRHDYIKNQFDWVIGIFIQFADANSRRRLFTLMSDLTRPGGHILLQGYTPKQLEYKTGGPPNIENLYTESMLKDFFNTWTIKELVMYEKNLTEGVGHNGQSALVGLVAQKPI